MFLVGLNEAQGEPRYLVAHRDNHLDGGLIYAKFVPVVRLSTTLKVVDKKLAVKIITNCNEYTF